MDNEVRIQNGIAQFGNVKYPIANISSFRAVTTSTFEEPFWWGPGYGAICVAAYATWKQGTRIWLDAATWYYWLLPVAAIAMIAIPRKKETKTYSLYLNSTGGEALVYSTNNKAAIDAVEESLVQEISGVVRR